jgi:RNA polymerase sigma-70 factor (ECF subfamily)
MIRDLVVRAQGGDHDAFEQIARIVVGRLYATASLIVRDGDAAHDAVQETLIDAWRNLPTLRDPDAFDGWLYRILVRACYRAVRNQRRHRTEVSPLEQDAPTMSDESRIDTIDQIERAFRRLTPEQRAVIVLHHRIGLPLAEAARILEIPVGTMKSRLNRATAALRASLEADDRDATAMEGRTA